MNAEKPQFRRVQATLTDAVYELTKIQFTLGPAEVWRPAVNVYRCKNCVVVCVDLAGIDPQKLEVRVQPDRVLVRGRRDTPEPESCDQQVVQILTMEIDCGAFEREVRLPWPVESSGVTAEQRNGMLWITLPLRAEL